MGKVMVIYQTHAKYLRKVLMHCFQTSNYCCSSLESFLLAPGTRINNCMVNIGTVPVLTLYFSLLVEVYSEKLQEIEVQHILNMSSESIRKLHIDEKLNKEFQVELARMKRNDEVMMKFSKALWSVLKQYKNKLEVKFLTGLHIYLSSRSVIS